MKKLFYPVLAISSAPRLPAKTAFPQVILLNVGLSCEAAGLRARLRFLITPESGLESKYRIVNSCKNLATEHDMETEEIRTLPEKKKKIEAYFFFFLLR